MKYFLIMLIVSLSAFAGVPVQSGDPITAHKFNNQTFGVGDIKHSILNLSQFQNQFGDCWVKMEGQSSAIINGSTVSISATDYGIITGNTTLPNASGRFLRNIGGDAPALGLIQDDSMQGHTHGDPAGAGGFISIHQNGSAPGATYGGPPQYGSYQNLSGPIINGFGTPRVSAETRPKNLGVNFFLKINHNCN